MRRYDDITQNLDWITIVTYLVLILFGWLNIYASTYEAELAISIFDLGSNSGKQLLFIGLCIPIIISIMILDFRFFDGGAWVFYAISIITLIAVLLLARDINGASSWFEIFGMRFQPSELAKFTTALFLAKVMSGESFKSGKLEEIGKAFLIFFTPMVLIILQKDAGTALVFLGFLLVLYREGMSPAPLIIGILAIILSALSILLPKIDLLIGVGVLALVIIFFFRKSMKWIFITVLSAGLLIGFVYSVDYVMTDVLKEHQRDRILLVFNPNSDPLGKGWNITQSKIAIGSGGFMGKGYLKGTQTKFDFVPEQSTDFIFCTIGEEHGFIGSIFVISVFVFLILRIIALAERQKFRFARIYGYSVASIFLVHFMINIGMTMGLLPVIGIPLPFFSYGGSSLLSFTILLFIFLKMDAHRNQVLDR